MNALRGRLSVNTLTLLFSNSGSAVLSFALSVLIGRALGQTGLGIYAASLAWIYPLSLITEFGIGTLITRNVAQVPEDSHAYVRASVITRLIFGSILMACVWLTAPLLSSDATVQTGLRVASPLIIILPFYSSFTAIFRARQIMLPIALLNLGMLLTQVTWTAYAVWSGSDILTILAINAVTSALQLVAAWIVYRLYFYYPTKEQLSLRRLLSQASPFAIAAILAAVQARLTIIMLEQFTSTDIVGLYAAAFRFIEAGRLIPHAFFDALFPLLAGLATVPNQLNQIFRRVLMGLTVFGILFGVGVTVIASPLMQFTYGDAFSDATSLLILLSWSVLPMLLKSGRTLYWYALGRENTVNTVTGIVIVIQLGLSLWLIPLYGAMGAVSIVISAEVIATLLLFMKRP